MSSTSRRSADVWLNDIPSNSKAVPASEESKDLSSNREMADKKQSSGASNQTLDSQRLFLQAKASYIARNYTDAANDFEKLMNDTSSSVYDDSKWMLANCYIKIHKNAKSKKLLKEIAGSDSPHKKEALGLLQELQ
jgi:hypothetical protein